MRPQLRDDFYSQASYDMGYKDAMIGLQRSERPTEDILIKFKVNPYGGLEQPALSMSIGMYYAIGFTDGHSDRMKWNESSTASF